MPLSNLGLEEIIDIMDDYAISYVMMTPKGRIDYNAKVIHINAVYNDNAETLMHEITHHYLDNVLCIGEHFTEDDVELLALDYMLNNPNIITYLESRYLRGKHYPGKKE